jgi:tetratricopeptide (TPR) repeat protein
MKKSNLIILFLLVSFCFADIFSAGKIRAGNSAIKHGDFPKAQKYYEVLPATPRLNFNRGFLSAAAGQKEEGVRYYQSLIKNNTVKSQEKAKAYFNLGNDQFKAGEIKDAIKYYRQGLLFDPKNKKLKHNLELANMAKVMKKSPQPQQDQQDQDKKQQQKKQKTEHQKTAEKMLDSFKDQELKNQQKALPKQEQKKNVEKDW